jgi:hypothetical protein
MLLTVSGDERPTFHQIPILEEQAIDTSDNGHAGGDLLDLEWSRKVRRESLIVDIVEEWGMQSFPASDPPSNW